MLIKSLALCGAFLAGWLPNPPIEPDCTFIGCKEFHDDPNGVPSWVTITVVSQQDGDCYCNEQLGDCYPKLPNCNVEIIVVASAGAGQTVTGSEVHTPRGGEQEWDHSSTITSNLKATVCNNSETAILTLWTGLNVTDTYTAIAHCLACYGMDCDF